MKKRYFTFYVLFCMIVSVLLFSGHPLQASDNTLDWYYVSGANPNYFIHDTIGGGLIYWGIRNDVYSSGSIGMHQITSGQWPFVIESGADTGLLYLDGNNNIGINTTSPSYTLDIHAATPEIEMDDTSAGAGMAHLQMSTNTFTLEGNSQQDIFNMDTRAGNYALNIDADSEVGIGTNTPSKKLHVRGSDSANLSDSTITARIENVTGTTGSRHMLQLVNRGNPLLWFHNTQNDIRWSMNPIDTSFVFSRGGSGGYEMQLYSNGNLVIRGTLTQNSDRNTKKNIEAVNPVNVLDKVAALPISTWQFKNDTEKSRHLGPMAQDFYAAFGLGRDEKGIAPVDVSGVALAAIKGLNTVVKDKDAKIVQLEGKVADLEEKLQAQQEQLARLSALEPVVAKLVHQLNAQGTMKVSFETTPAGNHSF